MNLYEIQKTLGAARVAARMVTTGLESQPGGDKTTADRVTHLQSEITTELNAATALSRALEGYSGVPTADQGRQLGWTFEDVAATVESLNAILRANSARTPLSMPLEKK